MFCIVGTVLSSCLVAGTHGSLKEYKFLVSKHDLLKEINKTIDSSHNIFRDQNLNYIVQIDGSKSDTLFNNRYNDGKNYITFSISENLKDTFEYTIQVNEDSLSNTYTSYLNITYAYDGKGNGGSINDNNFNKSNNFSRKKAIQIFEKDFISKFDYPWVKKITTQ